MLRLLIVLFCLLILIMATEGNSRSIRASDPFLRERIVKLVDAEGSSCTGVEVLSPKRVVYTLTAGHCRALLDVNNKMIAIDEQGKRSEVSLVAEDFKSDLLLLTAVKTTGIHIGESVGRHEKVKAITHGRGLEAFRTDGEMVQDELVTFAEELITTPEDLQQCEARAPKTRVVTDTDPMFGISQTLCLVETMESIATALILPGSSGGPLFNMKGEVVGIASAGTSEDPFGRFVRLNDIKAFMQAR